MITVFIGTFNRLSTLERTIDSYEQQDYPHEIVIVDNGTDDPLCLKLLEQLERRVKKIYSLPGCDTMVDATDNFNVAIRDQYDSSGGEWFAVSEADVCFDGSDPGSFAVYIRLAKMLDTAVGPHLRIHWGIPSSYPLRSRVLACETYMLYRRKMAHFQGMHFSKCQIDTTFHLFPRIRHFDRLNLNPVRVSFPYDAMHLDWHLNIFEPVQENGIYIFGGRPVGSWGKAWIRDYWGWFQEFGPEEAFERLLDDSNDSVDDLCNNSFLRSWCYQYGVGVDRDRGQSEFWLQNAIPYPHDYYWPNEKDWMKMIYEDDFTSLR